MGPRELRAGMRGPMRALGFQAGRLSFHLPLAGALRFTVSLRTTAMGDGGRAAIIGLALYRVDDWHEYCLEHGHDVDHEHDAGTTYAQRRATTDPVDPGRGAGDEHSMFRSRSNGYTYSTFQARSDLCHVLDRPHQHQWPLRGPQESLESAVSVARCVERFLRSRVALLEETADALIRSGSLVDPWQVTTTRLRDDELCPYGPCAEPGRPASSGGVDDRWWVRDGRPW